MDQAVRDQRALPLFITLRQLLDKYDIPLFSKFLKGYASIRLTLKHCGR
jgi:hypothetical protein